VRVYTGVVVAVALGVAGCGGSGGTTTVIEKQAAPTTTVVEQAAPTKTVVEQAAPTKTAVEHSSASDATTSSTSGQSVPSLVGEALDVAEDKLQSDGLNFKEVGGGVFGIVVKSNWTVCATRPAAGQPTSGPVSLIVERSCR
jgi:hypothetical protein